jgi:hypothetical protein
MKYLKKFNESSSEYYQIIDQSEWKDDIFYKSIHFEKKYIDEIKNRLKTEYKLTQPTSWIIEIVHYKWNNYIISQCQDEWFYAREDVEDEMSNSYGTNTYYKCDQFEGLLKLLKDNNAIE